MYVKGVQNIKMEINRNVGQQLFESWTTSGVKMNIIKRHEHLFFKSFMLTQLS